MRIAICGGDGFCGWPTALHLSAKGHEIVIIDDLSRRTIMEKLGVQSLVPVVSIEKRLEAWWAVEGKRIAFRQYDLSREIDAVKETIADCDAVIHLAEQSSAPYSMRGPVQRRYTVNRNVLATHNLLTVCPENVPIVHLGTMGVYGYSGTGRPIPEGWIVFGGKRCLHPFQPGSIYHATKCLDATLLEFYARNDGFAITDLHQGIVWGTQTDQTQRHDALANPFWADGDYGTVINRFLMQAATGHHLTMHGSGGQTRAFIHLSDTVRCIELAVTNPPKAGEYRVFNQAAETRRIRDVATMVSEMTGAKIQSVPNPRKEAAENELAVQPHGLSRLGWEPVTLSQGLLQDVIALAKAGESRVGDPGPSRVKW